MNYNEIKQLETKELINKLNDTKKEQFNLRFKSVTGEQLNIKRVRELRKIVAQIMTEKSARKNQVGDTNA